MSPQTTQEVIDRVTLLMRDMPATNAALKFEADTIVRLMEKEGAQPIDAIAENALRVFAKKLNVSASWLIEGRPGKAAKELRDALDNLAPFPDSDSVVEVNGPELRAFRERVERIPDAAAA